MPILKEEPNMYPDSLLDPDIEEAALSSDRHWWMLLTKARQEKTVARILWERKYPFYLPLLRREAIYNRHRVTATSPLFANYIFLYGSDDERVFALATKRVKEACKMADFQEVQRELRQIERLISSATELSVECRLVPGGRVRVKRGLLAGLEGTVLDRDGQTRLCLPVKSLQQGVSVEIDRRLLEPL